MNAFARYLAENGLTPGRFAHRYNAKFGTCHAETTFWRYSRYPDKPGRRPSLDVAARIERLTGGAVPVSTWERKRHDTNAA